MPNGTVKFFNAAKGFGFITPDEGGKDVFVPAASAVAAGVSSLKAGQRVSFEAAPDGKGPKAVNLTLLTNPHPPKEAKAYAQPPLREEEKMQLTFYRDPALDESHRALAALHAAGYEPRVVDYIATPPTKDELKSLSVRLRGSDQSLVRKYESLFLELRLDDRFISENEFWGAIAENPSLINGPVVATATKAAICRSEDAIESFLAAISPNGIQTAPKRKSLPEPVLRVVTDDAAAAPPVEEKEVEKAQLKSTKTVRKKVQDDTVKKTKAGSKAEVGSTTNTKTKIAVKAKAKAALKPPKPARKVAQKPIKKPKRAVKK